MPIDLIVEVGAGLIVGLPLVAVLIWATSYVTIQDLLPSGRLHT